MRVGVRPRRGLIALVCVLVSLSCAFHSARAELTERALAVGERVLGLEAAWLAAAPRELWLNGAQVRVASGASELSLSALLDRLEAGCRARSKVWGAPVRKLFGGHVPSLLEGVLRVEGEGQGFVACFELGSEPVGVWGALRKLQRFSRALDLAELGGIRMVRAESRTQGSFFVAAWSEGAVPLATMFPAAGDAPGFDLAGIGRPRHARRIFSALQAGREPTIVVYESSMPLAPLLREYAGQLLSAGFEQLGTLDEGTGPGMLLRSSKGTVLLTGSGDGTHTRLAVIALDGGFLRNVERASADTTHAMRQGQ